MTLEELHEKLKKHLENQNENWDSLIYAQEKGFYQGLDEIKIEGCRNTEKRFEEYGVEKYLSKEKIVLDIGSNCGFIDLYFSRFLDSITGVEINPFLIKIANEVKDFLKIPNAVFVCSKFEDYEAKQKFDIVCSFANDSTIDDNMEFSFKQYIEKIWNLLKNGGLVLFESQALDAFVPGAFDEKREFIKKYFQIIEEKKVSSEYPVNVPERFFLVLRKLDVS